MDLRQRSFDAESAKALANFGTVAARDVERAASDRPWSLGPLSQVPGTAIRVIVRAPSKACCEGNQLQWMHH